MLSVTVRDVALERRLQALSRSDEEEVAEEAFRDLGPGKEQRCGWSNVRRSMKAMFAE